MRRFFSPDSFWNQPIPGDAQSDPRSDELIALMKPYDAALHINMYEYTIPVYEAGPETPRRPIFQRLADQETCRLAAGGDERAMRRCRFRQSAGFGVDVPVPGGAVPDPAGDAHMAVVDWSTNTAWDMWWCRIREDGQYESATGMKYALDGTGVWTRDDFDVRPGESIHFFGPSRAAGVPAIAGLIMEWEVRAGRIEHKIAFACWSNVARQHQMPAAWTDGFREDGLPEGAVLQLDPDLDLEQFDLRPGARVIARALQEYGMVDTDNARGNCICAEGLYGHPDRSWDGLLDEDDLRGIPLECYRVLKLGPIVPEGDHKKPA
jgi:hypothetical protein